MALVSLGVVVNGVHGGAARDYVFLTLLVLSVSFPTLTLRPLGRDREGARRAAAAAGL